MNRYGQLITWSTPTAPHPFSGICTSYTYEDQLQRGLDEDESGDNRTLIQHSQKAEITFEAKATDASTDFLDLSTGGAVAISGLDTGIVLARRAVERWGLIPTPKTLSFQGTHYPDITQNTPALAGVDLNAFTPTQSLAFLFPGANLIVGTAGLGHAAGVVHGLEIAQELQITEDDPDPTGKIKGAASHGYLRTISLDVLFLTTGTIPANGTKLTITGAPTHAANMRLETIGSTFAHKRGRMLRFNAVWIPGMT